VKTIISNGWIKTFQSLIPRGNFELEPTGSGVSLADFVEPEKIIDLRESLFEAFGPDPSPYQSGRWKGLYEMYVYLQDRMSSRGAWSDVDKISDPKSLKILHLLAEGLERVGSKESFIALPILKAKVLRAMRGDKSSKDIKDTNDLFDLQQELIGDSILVTSADVDYGKMYFIE